MVTTGLWHWKDVRPSYKRLKICHIYDGPEKVGRAPIDPDRAYIITAIYNGIKLKRATEGQNTTCNILDARKGKRTSDDADGEKVKRAPKDQDAGYTIYDGKKKQ
ncbi:MAG: hypothetical protein Q9218_007770 [Villophora microphyllina]